MVGGDGVGDLLQKHRLAGARRRHDQPALALADRRDDIDDARRKILLGGILVLHAQPLVRIERRQVVEIDLVAGFFRVFEVDGVDLEKGEIAFRPLSGFGSRPRWCRRCEAEAADLRGRNVDVVGPRQILRLGSAQEAETVLENFDDAFADNVDFVLGKLLENREHQLLLAHGRGVLDAVFFGKNKQFSGGFGLEVLEFHFPHAGDPVGRPTRKRRSRRWKGRDRRSFWRKVVGEARR